MMKINFRNFPETFSGVGSCRIHGTSAQSVNSQQVSGNQKEDYLLSISTTFFVIIFKTIPTASRNNNWSRYKSARYSFDG